MAKASRDAKWKTCSEDLPNFGLPVRQNPLQYYLVIGTLSHIKGTEIWKKPDVYKNSYFILPSKGEGGIQPSSNSIFQMQLFAMVLQDFVKFWHELSDDHKERRLMLNYFCAIRGIEEIYDKMGILGRDDMKVLMEMVSEYTSIFRQLWIKEQHLDDLKDLEDTISVFSRMGMGFHVRHLKMFRYFSTPFDAAVSILKKKCGCSDRIFCSANDIVHKITDRYIPYVIDGLIKLYMDWDSFEMAKENQRVLNMESAVKMSAAKSGKLSNPKEGDQKRFVSKVNAQVPHWNKIDRAKILGMIENPGDGPMDFMRKLMEEVGMEKFKILALGKEYFCATCNRSSYIGEDRLWACPQCHWECTRPMARYCDENCQKADWIKHELEFHSVDVCNICKKKAEPGKKFGRCGRCLKENVPNPAVYCDEVCQKQDWPKHKVAKHTKMGA